MIVETAVPMQLADGSRLLADIYRPDSAAPVPALLERTPYGRRRCDQAEIPTGAEQPRTREAMGRIVSARGHALVVQECRGTGESEGVFEKYVHEAADGAAAISWTAARPWCDGRVVTMGFSYAATTQLAAAAVGAPALAAMCLDSGGFFDAHASGIRRGGAFEMKQATWAYTHAQRTAQARGDPALAAAVADQDLDRWLRDTPWRCGHSPLSALPDQERQLADYWCHEAKSPFWQQPALYARGAIARIAPLPSLLLTTWFDTSLVSTLALWQALQQSGVPAPRRLLIGPWTHGNRHQPWAGDLDFGAAATAEAALGADLLQARLDWAEQALQRAARPTAAPVRLFLMGGGPGDLDAAGRRRHGGSWLDAEHWPPPSQAVAWHLQPGGGLARTLPRQAAAPRFAADPRQPVATRGGAINAGEPWMAGGAFGDDGPCRAGHVLRFESAALDAPLCIAGPVRARLFVATDGPDADLTIKLFDVYPDGCAYGLTDGILRLSHRDPARAPLAVTPGAVMAVEVEAYPSANRFERGHRIRIEIAGSNFPRFDLNPHTDPAQRRMADARVATTTVHIGPEQPSALVLQVLDAAPPPV